MFNYRPLNFNDIIGQDSAKDVLRSKALSYLKSDKAVGHMLFLGPSGVGKTTFAQVYANMIGVTMHEILATTINSWRDLTPYILKIKENDVLFIDEIHALKPKIQEALYYIMEDFKYMDEKGTVKLPRFTLMGATTHEGLLNAPLMRRFVTKVYFDYYTNTELAVMKIHQKTQWACPWDEWCISII